MNCYQQTDNMLGQKHDDERKERKDILTSPEMACLQRNEVGIYYYFMQGNCMTKKELCH
jgi:hypothetical protein